MFWGLLGKKLPTSETMPIRDLSFSCNVSRGTSCLGTVGNHLVSMEKAAIG